MWRRVGLTLLVLLTLMLGLTGYQVVAVQLEAQQNPPPGQLIDIGGYRLHLHCTGTGNPTLLLDAGAGNWSIFWAKVQATLAKEHRVCSFDRAGYGWSELSPNPRTSQQMAQELHLLLQKAGLEPPFVLVGHSLGGYNARVYRDLFPQEVVALVLVDSAHPQQWKRLPEAVGAGLRQQVQTLNQASTLAQLGVLRLMQSQLPQFDLPLDMQGIYMAAMMRPQTYRSFAAEAELATISAAQVEQGKPLGNLPLLVLTAGKSFEAFRKLSPDLPFEASNRVWLELQAELVELSGNATQRIKTDAGHYLMVDEPAYVSTSIADFLQRVFGPRP